ncbi:MAG: hypothetical protein JXD21_03775 [Candidatus Omnitrophica bacterium]|nr:hypothetical protein [Candidatus Omnitrophota bacterium]
MSRSCAFNEKQKTITLLIVGSVVSVLFAWYTQTKAALSVSSCSYLDPILVDITAFIAGIFLISEGIYKLLQHRETRCLFQFTRCLRVWLGVSITVIHILQFIHK